MVGDEKRSSQGENSPESSRERSCCRPKTRVLDGLHSYCIIFRLTLTEECARPCTCIQHTCISLSCLWVKRLDSWFLFSHTNTRSEGLRVFDTQKAKPQKRWVVVVHGCARTPHRNSCSQECRVVTDAQYVKAHYRKYIATKNDFYSFTLVQ